MAAPRSPQNKGNYADSRLELIERFFAEPLSFAEQIEAVVKLLRTAYWFETLALRLSQSTAYAVGRCVCPQTYNRKSKESGSPYHHNLWAAYARSRKHPGPHVRREAEALVPESGTAYRHPLWEVLNVSTPICDRGDSLIHRLHPAIQKAIFEPRALEVQRYRRRPTLIRTLRQLESYAGLDALAGLIVLLREAHAADNHADAFEIGHSLYRMLLMLNATVMSAGLGMPFTLYLQKAIFPLAENAGVGLDIQPREFMQQTFFLWQVILTLEDQGMIHGVNGGRSYDWLRILMGDFGMSLRLGLAPRYKLMAPSSDADLYARQTVASHNVGRDWGFETVLESRIEKFAPESVLNAMAEALIAS